MTLIFALIMNKIKDFLWRVGPIVAVIAIFFFAGYFQAKDHWQAPLLEEIKQYQNAEKKLTTSIEKIKSDAETSAAIAELNLIIQKNKIDGIESAYQELKSKSPKVIYKIKDPSKDGDLNLEFDSAGDMICSKFSDAYTSTLNSMIEEANRK